jgi:uncharacterized SAM-binding protein YcdF (DUF218 family)
MRKILLTLISMLSIILVVPFVFFYIQGKRFALRDRLKKSDAIIVLAGTRGNIKFLDGKIATAVKLYKEGWARYIIGVGKFSLKITDRPQLIPAKELQLAAAQGRIQEKDLKGALEKWDMGLGATYIREQVIASGVLSEQVLIEAESLHTRENAEYVLQLLKQHGMRRIILVTSPFHQLRTYLTFAKVFQLDQIEIINHYAEADDWHPLTWFLLPEHRKLVKSEQERIKTYRAKGDLL